LNVRKAHCAAKKPHIETVLMQTLAAELAHITRPARIDGHAYAWGEPPDFSSDLIDGSGNLVTKDHRLPDSDSPETAVVVIVQIRTANSAGLNAHAHVARAQGGGRNLFDSEVFGSMDDDATHD
jgi:hypothetical protein